MEKLTRPSRAQQNLFSYIESFVQQHGYGPSYREIMRALGYKSVSTVAIHIDGLIAKGQLRKQGRSARSLEVVKNGAQDMPKADDHEAWLVCKVTAFAITPDANAAALKEMAQVFGRLRLSKAKAEAESHLP